MTSLAARRGVQSLQLVIVGAMCVSCGTFFWESDNRDYTSPPAERTSLVYYSVVQESTGEVVFQGCFARSSSEEGYDSIRAPIGEPYSVTIRIGSRPGEVETDAQRQQACSLGPTTWEIDYTDGRCLKPRNAQPHELLTAVVLDDNGNTNPSMASDSTHIVGSSTRLTLISTQPGLVELLRSQKPCVCQGDCLVAYAFNVLDLSVN